MTNRDQTCPAAIKGAEPIRTLVADDSAQWLTTLCAFLAREAAIAVVGAARDGLEALGHAAALRPELVVLDVRMPRMNGLEAAALIRARHPEVRIVMMSTDTDAGTREACFAHGAHAFVPKGETARALLPAIFRLFGGGDTSAPVVPGTAQFQSA